jgi:hypothetical protein
MKKGADKAPSHFHGKEKTPQVGSSQKPAHGLICQAGHVPKFAGTSALRPTLHSCQRCWSGRSIEPMAWPARANQQSRPSLPQQDETEPNPPPVELPVRPAPLNCGAFLRRRPLGLFFVSR